MILTIYKNGNEIETHLPDASSNEIIAQTLDTMSILANDEIISHITEI